MSTTTDHAAYWRAVSTALGGIITQSTLVKAEHCQPIHVDEYVGTGIGGPRFIATTSSEPGHGWRRVARVDTDGLVTRLGNAF